MRRFASQPMMRALALVGLVGLCAADSDPADDVVVSGDTIFLWSWQNKSIDVGTDGVARARWALRGNWQAMTIEKEGGLDGPIRAGEAVTIKAHSGGCLQLLPEDGETVAATQGRCPVWRIDHVAAGPDRVRTGESIYLTLVGQSKVMDVAGGDDGLVRARWDLRGQWQTLRIEREDPAAVLSGQRVTIAAPSGVLLDVADTQLRARWREVNAWKALVVEGNENLGEWIFSFTINGGGGRAVYSGDSVQLWADNGHLVDVQTQLAQARWGAKAAGAWQSFVVENAGGGVIRHGDPIHLRAHTGKYLQVQGDLVEAAADEPGSSGALVFRAAGESDKSLYKQGAFLGVVLLGTMAILVYELCQPQAPLPAGGAPRLEALDAPRWIASVQIIAFHYYDFKWGGAWTQFFFVLSGFVLAYVEMARPEGRGPKVGQLRYVTHRMVTLYPTYLCVLAMSAIQWRHSALDWITLPLHIVFAQAWFPLTYKKLGTARWQWSGVQWVAVSWFVSVLVVYWFCLRPLARRVRKMSLRLCAAALLLLWACAALWAYLGSVVLPEKLGCVDSSQRCYVMIDDAIIYHGWLGMFHVFLSGIVMARVFILTSMCDAEVGGAPCPDSQKLSLDPARAPIFFRYGAILGYLLYGALLYFVGASGYTKHETFFHNGGILPVLWLVLAGGALGHDPVARHVFRNRLFRLLGRISYAQYLMQVNVYAFLSNIFPEQGALVRRAVVFPFALFVLSYLLERLVTRVGVEWLKPGGGKTRKGSIARAISFIESKGWGGAKQESSASGGPVTATSAESEPPAPAPEAASPRLAGSPREAPAPQDQVAPLAQPEASGEESPALKCLLGSGPSGEFKANELAPSPVLRASA